MPTPGASQNSSSHFIGAAILLLAVIALPFWYGGVLLNTQFRFAIAVVAALAFAAAGTLARPTRLPMAVPLVSLPVMGLIALAGFQLIPLAKTQSIDAAATRVFLSQAAIVLGCQLAGFSLLQTRLRLGLFCAAIAAAGIGVGFFGLVDRVGGTKLFFNDLSADAFGPFVNKNHAAMFLGIAVASAIGAMGIFDTHRKRGRNIALMACVAAVAALLLASAATYSRAGFVAVCCALLPVIAIAMVTTRSGRRAALVACVLIAIGVGVTLSLEIDREIIDRFREVAAQPLSERGRYEHWESVLPAGLDRPLTGWGFGTYSAAHQPWLTEGDSLLFAHADNQYVEFFVEGGGMGAGIALLLVIGLLAPSLRMLWMKKERAFGACGCVLATYLALHAFFDWGIVLAANAAAAAALSGGIEARYRMARTSERTLDSKPKRRFPVPVVCSAALVALAAIETRSASHVESAKRASQELRESRTEDITRLDTAIKHLRDALNRRPDDAEGQRELGELYVYRYRVTAMRNSAQNGRALRWEQTRLNGLAAAVLSAGKTTRRSLIDRLTQLPAIRHNLKTARDQFRAAREANPLLPGVQIRIAELDSILEVHGYSRDQLVTLGKDFPGRTADLARGGLLAWHARDEKLAFDLWRLTLASGVGYDRDLASFWSRHVPFQELENRVFPSEPARLVQLLSAVKNDQTLRDWKLRLLAQIERLADSDEAVIARAYHLVGKNAQAETAYRKALKSEPGDTETRIRFADFLYETRKFEEAIQQLDACVNALPHRPRLRERLRKWVRESGQ